MRYDVIWRHGTDTVLATFTHHYAQASSGGFAAVAYDGDAQGLAAAASPGDPLVLKITVTGGDSGVDFVPNGDGQNAGGRIPRLDLPP